LVQRERGRREQQGRRRRGGATREKGEHLDRGSVVAPESRRPRHCLVEGCRHRFEPTTAADRAHRHRIEAAAVGSRELCLHAVDLLHVGPCFCSASMP
jgi:hypothetical protein